MSHVHYRIKNFTIFCLLFPVNYDVTNVDGGFCTGPTTHPSVLAFFNYFESSKDKGTVTHRVTIDPAIMNSVKGLIAPAFPEAGNLTWTYVITYNKKSRHGSIEVPACGGPKNRIQIMIVAGPKESYTIFLYKQLEWVDAPEQCPGKVDTYVF